MTGVFTDSWEMFKFSFTWLKDKDSVRLFAASSLLAISYVFISSFFLGWDGAQDFSQYYMNSISGKATYDSSTMLFLGAIGVVVFLLQLWLSTEAFVNALNKVGIKTPRFNFTRIFKFILVYIGTVLAAFFSTYDLRFLAIPALAIIILLAAPAEFLISAILLALYLVVIGYFSFRLMFSIDFYLIKKSGIRESLDLTYSLTKGRVKKIFLRYIAVMFLLIVIMALAGLVFGMIFAIIGYFSQNAFYSLALTKIFDSILNVGLNFGMMYFGAYLLFLVVTWAGKSSPIKFARKK
ncbi:hypothetical protein HY989_00345 [Candidatus Micrarchaeota archaeon]|nr:hypothetical protein [Candidatus Micrarchaeota archaeon]